MKIRNVRISGFKSFADPVDFAIEPGVTGIVGPNGCGKSNLIEALRWAQGETSAKRMRAEGMDDVIFGGTETRPAKAACEVTVSIDNSDRKAPPEFNHSDSLEVTRRIERGDGSSYRVNGKETRARDVKVLFQDAGVGAGSAAHVSQGAVGSLINAKPSDRRSLLEEAAGVSGLASRRHEADLRLKGTEQNLERAEDLEKGLGEQMVSLRKQARQAARRKAIDGLVRAAEATAFLVRRDVASARSETVRAAHESNEARVAEAILAVREAEADVARVEQAVAPAMKERMEAETAFALAKAALATVEREAAAVRSARASAHRSRERAEADAARERATAAQAAEELLEIDDEIARTEDDRANDAEDLEYAAATLAEAQDAAEAARAKVELLAAEVAGLEASRRGAEARRSDAAVRLAGLEARGATMRKQIEADEAKLAALGEAGGEIEEAEAFLSDAEAELAAAETTRVDATEAEERARLSSGEAASALSAANAELKGLKAAGQSTGGDVASAVDVDDGAEEAFAAALGEGVRAALGTGNSRWWVASSPRPACPAGSVALSSLARFPSELAAALSGVGVVATDADAEGLAASLVPGQALVTRAGGLWRWDGYRTSGVGSAAEEVRRTARVRALEAEAARLAAAAAEARAALDATRASLQSAKSDEARSREAARGARASLEQARRRHEAAARERMEAASRIAAAAAGLDQVKVERGEAIGAVARCDAELAAMPDRGAKAHALSEARKALEAADGVTARARTEMERVRRDADGRATRLAHLGRSREETTRRRVASHELALEMDARTAEAAADEARHAAAEEEAPARAEDARVSLDAAEEALAASLAAARGHEEELALARANHRSAEGAVAALREDRARLLAEIRAAQQASEELSREIAERLGCAPDGLDALSGLEPGAEPPDLQACEARVARLSRERDGLGTVNLLAEEQVVEMEGRLGDAQKAREELREAVRRLRATIAEFDREARERLTEAFALVDGHFRDLFERLFRGGHAHLRLSGSDDPLTAGLEVYACPPGKKLQTLSLMSGGEQAMSAIALIFAAFLVKPAPVCVLDEVDAPLDDANVDRLCSLVSDMARKDATRFLVVTHHALTMARVDRLYGVTMAERGVSRLTAMDLASAAERLVD